MTIVRSFLFTATLFWSLSSQASCPDWMNQTFRQLHSTNDINLCERFANKPMLIVNTASHCGFTHQFGGLESLYQRYKEQGLAVVGFASNDFRQEDKSEAKAATICYENYGVTFTMMAPISVKGANAHPLFKTLASKSEAPSWNFNKFLVSADGKQVTHFGSTTTPDSEQLNIAIKSLL
jgi:glutathione peroxidase